ncbi:hypothetical protein Ppa06_65400 [Planomonospora parontospora subsp. parontospora]|uniref:Flagellar hook-basal body complex protein FliE n=2 Tax=Planomonospora parontospora TaxID=58119 RepID=A0AA37BPI4_9ACTN|nr:flagellar hook-basal body complex protein FliE [Planomonospora parontospora]GGK96287.1 hypothetical protein GCM10010126_64660 [Planomonospora parontospora]GII12742.1 hypothetical protein Ppa06_65400 [Planomonospora parontospora subsp. parontospora]
MSIQPIGPVAGPLRITGPAEVGGTAAPSGTAEIFGNLLTQGVDTLQQTQANADSLAVKAATGDLQDAHDYMAASTEAALATQMTVAIRDKAVAAFTEIMRMQA